MKLIRRRPEGLECANTLGGGLRYHAPSDWSCMIEKEDLPFGCSNFTSQLLDDMATRNVLYLERHYPELVFQRVSGRKGKSGRLPPLGHDYKVELGKGWWHIADWRTS